MRAQIDELVTDYEDGRLSRRQLVMHLSAFAAALAAGGGAAAAEGESTFAASELNHIALRVTDLDRSQAFYERHLGLRRTSGSSSSRFLSCGPHFVAMFKSDEPGLDHFCFTIPDYRQQQAAERLRAAGLTPRLAGGRTYFSDPDDIELQLANANR